MTGRRSPKIVQVIPSIAPAFGGPAVGALGLHQAMTQLGVQGKVLSAGYEAPGGVVPPGRTRPLSAAPSAFGPIYPASRPHRWENSFGLLLGMIAEIRRSDGVHIHGLYRPATTWAYFCSRMFNKPYGLQAHGVLEPYQRRKSFLRKRLFDTLITTHIVRNARYVMFASESEASRAESLVPRSKWLVVQLGAYLALPEPPAPSEAVQRVLNSNEGSVVLFLGRLARKKRPDILLQAWAQVPPEARGLLVICGPDGEFKTTELSELAKQLRVSDSVLFWGPAVGETKAWLLDVASIFVLPSENENFGIAVAEAMLAGCHVVTTREVAASTHLVACDAGVVLNELSARVLADELVHALGDVEESRRSGIRARQYARSELSWRPAATAVVARLTRRAR